MPAQNKLGPLNIHHAYQRSINLIAANLRTGGATDAANAVTQTNFVRVVFSKTEEEVLADVQLALTRLRGGIR